MSNEYDNDNLVSCNCNGVGLSHCHILKEYCPMSLHIIVINHQLSMWLLPGVLIKEAARRRVIPNKSWIGLSSTIPGSGNMVVIAVGKGRC